MSNDAAETELGLPTKLHHANETMSEARRLYDEAVDAMKLLEAQRSLLVGPSWDMNRAAATLQRLLPKIMKIGGMVAGGGGITALMADPGAFAGILGKLGGLFGAG